MKIDILHTTTGGLKKKGLTSTNGLLQCAQLVQLTVSTLITGINRAWTPRKAGDSGDNLAEAEASLLIKTDARPGMPKVRNH